ncbi:MAG: ABC transporter permease subunit [Clostridia bacterium]|nr:ABC transporter permease subunit [Clostridia bacterium]
MLAIFKREMRAYFTDPLGYVFLAVFLFVCNLNFYLSNLTNFQSDFSPIFLNMILFLTLLIPLMTMRLWSDEKKQKTDQLLLTAPVSTTSVVLGKFSAAMALFLIGLAFTVVYPILVNAKGVLDVGKTVGNYVGIILVAAAYISISLFVSSLTKSQIVSAICSILALALFVGMDLLVNFSTSPILNTIFVFLSLVTRYRNIFIGVLPLSDIFYFISVTGIFLFLTSRVIEKQRWS